MYLMIFEAQMMIIFIIVVLAKGTPTLNNKTQIECVYLVLMQ